MMWQPIETAPKRDDVQILTFHADFAPKHGRNKLQKESCYWYQTSFWSEKFGLFVGWPLNIQPTHWMELPAPPLPAQDWKKEPAHVPPLVEWAKGLQSNAERVPDNRRRIVGALGSLRPSLLHHFDVIDVPITFLCQVCISADTCKE